MDFNQDTKTEEKILANRFDIVTTFDKIKQITLSTSDIYYVYSSPTDSIPFDKNPQTFASVQVSTVATKNGAYWLKFKSVDHKWLYIKVEKSVVKSIVEDFPDEGGWKYVLHKNTVVGNLQVTCISTGLYGYPCHTGVDFAGMSYETFRKTEYPVYSPVNGTVILSHNYNGNHYATGKKKTNDDLGNSAVIETDTGFDIKIAHLKYKP
jgi:murein DD-endopeptidase MepM/ murein hydrolase activator NlpD